jgi:hypothetical protein
MAEKKAEQQEEKNYNNENVDLVKSLIDFFQFAGVGKCVVFNLSSQTFELFDEWDQFTLPEDISASKNFSQVEFRSSFVLIDGMHQIEDTKVRLKKLLTCSLQNQLPFYLVDSTRFIFISPASGAFLSYLKSKNSVRKSELIETYILEFMIQLQNPPSTFSLGKLFKTFIVEGPVY